MRIVYLYKVFLGLAQGWGKSYLYSLVCGPQTMPHDSQLGKGTWVGKETA